METLPQSETATAPAQGTTLRPMQVRVPEKLLRRAKSVAAESGSTLQQFVWAAMEERLRSLGKAA